MTGEWIIGIILWILLSVAIILSVREYLALRRELAIPFIDIDLHLPHKAARFRGADALHGHLDLEELHKYYDSI